MIDGLVLEYNNSNKDIQEAYKAGFTKCVQIIEQTIKNKNIMISLKSILENKQVVTRTRNTNAPDMIISKEGDKTQITVSQSYFDKADLQNNKIMCVFEPGDNKVYFIVHSDEELYSDFMTGKRLALKDGEGKDVLDANGKKVYSDEIGKKSRTFQDKKTAQDLTLVELLEKVTVLGDKTEFDLVQHKPETVVKEAAEFSISSIWSIENKADKVVVVKETITEAKNEETEPELKFTVASFESEENETNPVQYDSSLGTFEKLIQEVPYQQETISTTEVFQ